MSDPLVESLEKIESTFASPEKIESTLASPEKIESTLANTPELVRPPVPPSDKNLLQIYTGYISGYKPSLPLGIAERLAQKVLKLRHNATGGLDEEDIKVIQRLVRQFEAESGGSCEG